MKSEAEEKKKGCWSRSTKEGVFECFSIFLPCYLDVHSPKKALSPNCVIKNGKKSEIRPEKEEKNKTLAIDAICKLSHLMQRIGKYVLFHLNVSGRDA